MKHPVRVLQVVWGFEPFGGLEHHVTELSIALAARGHSVAVFTENEAFATNDYVRRLRGAGVSVSGAGPVAALVDRVGQWPLGPIRAFGAEAARLLGAASAPGDNGAPSLTASRAQHLVSRDLFRRLDEAITEGAPTIVHVHGTRLQQAWVVSWAHARGLPTMYTEHTTLGGLGGAIDEDAVAVMQRDVGVLATVSERARASLVATLGKTETSVVPHIVAADSSASSIATDGPLRVAFVGRLEHHKGVDLLLHAIAAARLTGTSVQLTVAGGGSLEGPLNTLARDLGLSDVRWLGAVPPSSIGAVLRGAELLVLPSRTEGLPVTLIEAMAHGRAAIATRVGGNAEVVVQGITGLLVDSERPEQLAVALAGLAEDRVALARMGDSAREVWSAGPWTPSAVAATHVALYELAQTRVTAR